MSKYDGEKSGKTKIMQRTKIHGKLGKRDFIWGTPRNSYTKFIVNISQDDREKSGKLNLKNDKLDPTRQK